MLSDIILFQPKADIELELKVTNTKPPPLSLLYLSSKIDEEGYNIKIIDQRMSDDWKRQLKKERDKVLCVGITSTTGKQIKHGLEISSFCKKIGVPTVWGGVHASLLPHQTLMNENIDFVVTTEKDMVKFAEVGECERFLVFRVEMRMDASELAILKKTTTNYTNKHE